MPDRFQTISKNPDLVQQVVDQLTDLISGGLLPVGEEMPPEAVLSERFGVSRTVTREAIRTLRGLGLVEVSRGRRPRVRQPSADTTIGSLHLHLQLSRSTLLQQIEVRIPVECNIAELAATRRSQNDIAALEIATHDLSIADCPEHSADADLRFHRSLAVATGNPLFESLLGAIGELMRQSMGAKKDEHKQDVMLQIHRDILAAVRDQNPAAAREAMSRHFVEAKKILISKSEELS